MSRGRALILAYLGALTAALVAGALHPVALQKSNAIRSASALPALASGGSFDALTALRAIPYTPGETWSVDPGEKYRRTIEEGRGNCSQMTFGLAWKLDRERHPFQVVHILPVDSFLAGGGHTLLRTRIPWGGSDRVALVDLYRGALPMSADQPIDVPDLVRGPVADLRFEPVDAGGRDSSVYFGPFLESAVIGVIEGRAVAHYFRFLEAVYMPLGHERLEKITYDGLSLVLGFYPAIFVADVDRLFAGRGLERASYRAALWLIRSAIVVLPLLLLVALRGRRERA